MRSLKNLIYGLCASTLFVASVYGGFTTVMSPPGGEFTHKQIFECTYGGTFTASGLDFINGGGSGTITATRVDDNDIAGLLNLLTGSPGSGDDDIWTDGIASCTAEARFAGNSQEFGYRVSSFSYVKLFDVSGASCSATGGPATVTFGTGATWEWARANDSDSGPLDNPHYSDEPSNSDGLDHMVTYAITGVPGVPVTTRVWAVFFEDVSGGGSDRDFNDLMVEVRAVQCLVDTDCENDGQFCNGDEVCNADGVCVSAGNPCSPPSDLCCEETNQCKAQCCSNADCPSNGLYCDGVEVCENGFCVSPGNPCPGGAPECCEGTDSCQTQCCSDADCQAPNPPCEGGELCISGMCVAQPDAGVLVFCEADSPPNLCRIDHCNGMGQCVFLNNKVCQGAGPPCEGGQYCDPADGLCKDNPDADEGTPCEADKNLCTVDQCDGEGHCVRFDFVMCPDPVGDCEAGAHCVTTTGLCVEDEDPPLSTSCDTDGDFCTLEHCDGNGSCVPMDPPTVICQTANSPCDGGEVCDQATGLCVPQDDTVAGVTCEAESPPDLCTIDVCDGMGGCVNIGNVICQSPNPPCEGGQHCEPTSGLCIDDPDAELSTPCEAESPPNLCTNDHCNGAGQCVHLSDVICQAPNPPCEGGANCDPASGLCVAKTDADSGTPCEAESPPDLCTNDFCDGNGLCVHVSDVMCQGPIPPCEGGANCNPTTGMCVNKPDAVLSTPCELDSPPDLCSVDHCNGKGLCVFLRDVVCQSSDPPCEAGDTCNPATGICEPNEDAPESTVCTTDEDPCTNEHCDGSGLCVLLSDKCGACCDHNPIGGECADRVLPVECIGDQLEFFLNESCTAVEARGDCEQHRGACCDGTPKAVHCTDDVLPGDCTGDNQTWFKDASCSDVPSVCPELTLGTCCNTLDGICTDDSTIEDCGDTNPEPNTDQRVFTLDSTCANTACAADLGACCDTDPFGGCTETTSADCLGEKLEWTKGASCAIANCAHQAIPTLSQWGLVILTLTLLIGAKVFYGRRGFESA